MLGNGIKEERDGSKKEDFEGNSVTGMKTSATLKRASGRAAVLR